MKLIRYVIFLMICFSGQVYGNTPHNSEHKDAPGKLLHVIQQDIEHGWSKHHFVVGVLEAPPFSFVNKKTQLWEGIAIDIWVGLAQINLLTYEYKVVPSLGEGERALVAGEIDLLIGAFPAVPQNDNRIEYSLPFYVSGLGVAFPPQKEKMIFDFLEMLVSWEFLSAVFGVIVFVLTGSIGMWLVERRQNPLFGKTGFLNAIGNGMYWSAGTVTSVGSGDTLPRTPPGKAFSIFWMFIGVLMTSVLMAAITSSLTVGRLSSLFTNPKNLKSLSLGCVEGSDGEFYLSQSLIACAPQASLEDALNALLEGKFEALVYSDPLLRYQVATHKSPVEVYSTNYSQLYYSFVVRGGGTLLHEVNKAILLYVNGPDWEKNIFKYLKITKASVVKRFQGLL